MSIVVPAIMGTLPGGPGVAVGISRAPGVHSAPVGAWVRVDGLRRERSARTAPAQGSDLASVVAVMTSVGLSRCQCSWSGQCAPRNAITPTLRVGGGAASLTHPTLSTLVLFMCPESA